MPDFPTQSELEDAAEAQVLQSQLTKLNDFRTGSLLDAFRGALIGVAENIAWWISVQMRDAFVSTSEGDELEFVAVDRYGPDLRREPGESDEELEDRVDGYVQNGIRRGSVSALEYYTSQTEGVVDVQGVDLSSSGGAVVVNATYNADAYTESEVRDRWLDDIDDWRSPIPTSLELRGA